MIKHVKFVLFTSLCILTIVVAIKYNSVSLSSTDDIVGLMFLVIPIVVVHQAAQRIIYG